METCKNISTPRTRAWRGRNNSDYNQYMRDYRRIDVPTQLLDPNEIWFEKDARKRRALIQATPPWANHSDIRMVYMKCVELNQRYPTTGFVVHHIIPISHPSVCGLHTFENLKIVSIKLKKQLGRKFNSKLNGL